MGQKIKAKSKSLLHTFEYSWLDCYDGMSQINQWVAVHPEPSIQSALQDYQDTHPNALVPGIQNNPPFMVYEGIAGQTESRFYPNMYDGTAAKGVANVLLAMFNIATEVNGINYLKGYIPGNIYAYSGGCETSFVNLKDFSLTLGGDLHLFGPVLLGGDLESLQVNNIYVHRGYADWIGWLGFLNLNLEDIPDGHGGMTPAFTITVRFGSTGKVTYDQYNKTHSGVNGIREYIPSILKLFYP